MPQHSPEMVIATDVIDQQLGAIALARQNDVSLEYSSVPLGLTEPPDIYGPQLQERLNEEIDLAIREIAPQASIQAIGGRVHRLHLAGFRYVRDFFTIGEAVLEDELNTKSQSIVYTNVQQVTESFAGTPPWLDNPSPEDIARFTPHLRQVNAVVVGEWRSRTVEEILTMSPEQRHDFFGSTWRNGVRVATPDAPVESYNRAYEFARRFLAEQIRLGGR